VRNTVHFHFEWQRDQPLHFFGGVSRPLGDDLHHGWRQVGVGIDGHALEGDRAPDRNQDHHHQNQESLAQRRLHNAMDHARTSDDSDWRRALIGNRSQIDM
jgi:hypothetical protein